MEIKELEGRGFIASDPNFSACHCMLVLGTTRQLEGRLSARGAGAQIGLVPLLPDQNRLSPGKTISWLGVDLISAITWARSWEPTIWLESSI